LLIDGVTDCVADLEGVTDGVHDLDSVADGVTSGVPDLDGVTDGVIVLVVVLDKEAVLDFEGDTLGVGDIEVVRVCETV